MTNLLTRMVESYVMEKEGKMKNVFQVVKVLKEIEKTKSKNQKIKIPLDDVFITPFDCKMTDFQTIKKSRNNIFTITRSFKKEQFNNNSDSELSIPLENDQTGNKIEKKVKKRNVRMTWNADEQTSFVIIFLILHLYKRKLPLNRIIFMLKTRSYAQIATHYHRYKNIIKSITLTFFSYYDYSDFIPNVTQNNINSGFSKMGNPAQSIRGRDKNLKGLSLEDIFEEFKANLLDKNFIQYFNHNVHNDDCLNFFQKIFSYIIFEPKYLVTKKYINRLEVNGKSAFSHKKGKTEVVNEDYVKISKSQNSKRSEVSLFSSGKSKRKDFTSDEISNSNNNKNFYLAKNSLNEIISKQSINKFKIQNIKLQVEESFFSKLESYQSNSKDIVIDDNFLFKYICSDFILNSNASAKNKSP
jgi:hypothetical protein